MVVFGICWVRYVINFAYCFLSSLPWLLETLTFTHSVALVLVPLDVHRGEVSALAGHTRGPVHTRPA